jgi:DNA-binding GntR family transcriptional regulator
MGKQRDAVTSALRTMVVNGEFAQDRIFSQNELSAQFGVSRTPVREAIAILVQEGLLEQIPQVGIKVHVFTVAETADLLGTRSLLEAHMAEQLADLPPTTADIDALKGLLQEMRSAAKAGERPRFLKADASFHTEIARRAKSVLVAEMLERISDKIRVVGLSALLQPGSMSEVLAEHEAILSGIAKHDPSKASMAMKIHLQRTWKRLETVKT